MSACVEPFGTAIGAVCAEYGRSKWPITMLNHTHKHTLYRRMFCFLFLAPYARTTRYEEFLFSLENQGQKGSLRSRASWLLNISSELAFEKKWLFSWFVFSLIKNDRCYVVRSFLAWVYCSSMTEHAFYEMFPARSTAVHSRATTQWTLWNDRHHIDDRVNKEGGKTRLCEPICPKAYELFFARYWNYSCYLGSRSWLYRDSTSLH